jgi:hypothetical protein
VEVNSVVEALFNQLLERLDVAGGLVAEKAKRNVAEIGVKDG